MAEWVQGVPWYDVHYTCNKGEYTEFDNRTEVQAHSSDEAMQLVREKFPNVYVWAAYSK